MPAGAGAESGIVSTFRALILFGVAFGFIIAAATLTGPGAEASGVIAARMPWRTITLCSGTPLARAVRM